MEADVIECAERRIAELVGVSPVPEDAGHSRDTLKWITFLEGTPDVSLRLAALGHDIERAFPDRRVPRADYDDFDEYKRAHARNSARILCEILVECGVDEAIVAEVKDLVSRHEFGGTPRSDIIKYADSLSFFGNNLEFYTTRHTQDEIIHRIRWGLKRLPPHLRGHVNGMEFTDPELKRLVESEVARCEE
jgi:hypothetical protein